MRVRPQGGWILDVLAQDATTPDTAPATAATDTATHWIGVLFAIGSACFLVGPFPGFVELVGSEMDAAVFFAGSVFFTSAELLQMLLTSCRRDLRRELGGFLRRGRGVLALVALE